MICNSFANRQYQAVGIFMPQYTYDDYIWKGERAA